FRLTTLREATIGLARAINPMIDAEEADTITDDTLISIGIATNAELTVGANGWCAVFGADAEIVESHETLLGAALASILAAATAFHRLRGLEGQPNGCYSLWLGGGPGNAQGPAVDRVDVGGVLQ